MPERSSRGALFIACTTTFVMASVFLLAGCTQRVTEIQAEGQANKGQMCGEVKYICPDPNKLTEACRELVKICDSTDREDFTFKMSFPDKDGNPQEVVNVTSGKQDAATVVAAVENQSIATAQAAVQIAAIQGQAFADVFRTLAAAGVQIANPAGGVFTSANEFQAWAEGQQRAPAPVPAVTTE